MCAVLFSVSLVIIEVEVDSSGFEKELVVTHQVGANLGQVTTHFAKIALHHMEMFLSLNFVC